MTVVKWWDKLIHLSCHCQHLFAAVHILWRTKPGKWTFFLGQIEFCDVLWTISNLKWLITRQQTPGLCDMLADNISSVQNNSLFHSGDAYIYSISNIYCLLIKTFFFYCFLTYPFVMFLRAQLSDKSFLFIKINPYFGLSI